MHRDVPTKAVSARARVCVLFDGVLCVQTKMLRAAALRRSGCTLPGACTQVDLVPGEAPAADQVSLGSEAPQPVPTVKGTTTDPYLELKTLYTDHGAWADIKFPPNRTFQEFTMRFEFWQHKANSYYHSGVNGLVSTTGDTIARIQMRDNAYGPQQYCGGGRSLMHTYPGCECKFGQTIFERIFLIQFTYEWETGKVTITMDGTSCSFLGTPGLTPAYMRFGSLHWGLGWWTGHENRVGKFEYSYVEAAASTSSPTTAIATTPAPTTTTTPPPPTFAPLQLPGKVSASAQNGDIQVCVDKPPRDDLKAAIEVLQCDKGAEVEWAASDNATSACWTTPKDGFHCWRKNVTPKQHKDIVKYCPEDYFFEEVLVVNQNLLS